MLHEFITQHRTEIIARTRAKVESRSTPRPTTEELKDGVPLFLDQLVEVLVRSMPHSPAIGLSATRHGGQMLRMGFTVSQVVHDYGDICQTVTELAVETNAPITTDEFHTLNRCLDDAIAQAVTEFERLRRTSDDDAETERVGVLAHEMRNRLNAAMLAYATLKGGRVGLGGSTAAVLERNLRALRHLIDQSLVEVRIDAGVENRERIVVAELVNEIEQDAALEANVAGLEFSVAPVDHALEVHADRTILTSAMNNLLQNAFKFTRADGKVSLTTTSSNGNVQFDVEDECGGLPDGDHEELFDPFVQRGVNRAGVGLGLSISRKGIEATGGEITVRDIPGQGCVFTIELPRAAPSA